MKSTHLFKMTAWQNYSGTWSANDISNLSSAGSAWWAPCRVLGISPAEFIKVLKERFKATVKCNGDFVLYYWNKDQWSDCDSYIKYVNKEAKRKGVYVNEH